MKHKNAIVILAHGGPFDVAQAAMIMRGLKCDAEVLPIEEEGLVDWLECEAKRFSCIFLINVIFYGDESRAEAALRKLKKAGIAIEYAANAFVFRSSAELTRKLHGLGLFELFTADGADLRIPEHVEKRYGVDVQDLYGMGNFIWEDHYFVASVSAWEVTETTRWFYDNYGRGDLFTPMVQALARKTSPESFSPALAKAVEHWRNWVAD